MLDTFQRVIFFTIALLWSLNTPFANTNPQYLYATLSTYLPGIRVASIPPVITNIAAGYRHTCAITQSGGVKCWGNNEYGQLGDGTTVQRHLPVDVLGLSSGVKALALGHEHSCALTVTGGVKCWGDNRAGAIGNGAGGNANVRQLTPVDVVGMTSGIKAIAAGFSFTCAVTAEGSAKCWGINQRGQLGNGNGGEEVDYELLPVNVVGLSSEVTSIAAGSNFACAVTTFGDVQCWGANDRGQLGDGTGGNLGDHQLVPVNVVGLSSAISLVELGFAHGCALTSAGGVECWGSNDQGQVGDGTGGIEEDAQQLTAVDVVDLASGVDIIDAGNEFTCALTTKGDVKCWGSHRSGQQNSSNIPVDVVDLTTIVTAIAAGGEHACILTPERGVKCWGENNAGQLGNGTGGFDAPDQPYPVNVIWP
jgi:alpha-tubulin suppressor-like RCC1 family protein